MKQGWNERRPLDFQFALRRRREVPSLPEAAIMGGCLAALVQREVCPVLHFGSFDNSQSMRTLASVGNMPGLSSVFQTMPGQVKDIGRAGGMGTLPQRMAFSAIEQDHEVPHPLPSPSFVQTLYITFCLMPRKSSV